MSIDTAHPKGTCACSEPDHNQQHVEPHFVPKETFPSPGSKQHCSCRSSNAGLDLLACILEEQYLTDHNSCSLAQGGEAESSLPDPTQQHRAVLVKYLQINSRRLWI